jgi:hypothetical protein
MHKYLEAGGIEKQLQVDGKKTAVERWAKSKSEQDKKKSKGPQKPA